MKDLKKDNIDFETGTLKCPVCGTINNINSTSCSNCKTIFPEGILGSRSVKLNVDLKDKPKKKLKIKKLKEPLKIVKTREEIIADFMLVPGISYEDAKKAYNIGLRSLSELFYNVMSEKKISQSEYKCKILEDRIFFIKKGVNSTVTCPICKTVFPINYNTCRVCGANIEEDILKIKEESMLVDASHFIKKLSTEYEEGSDDKLDLSINDIDNIKNDKKVSDLDRLIENVSTDVDTEDSEIYHNKTYDEGVKEGTDKYEPEPVSDAEVERDENKSEKVEEPPEPSLSKEDLERIEIEKYINEKVEEFSDDVYETFDEVKLIDNSHDAYMKLLYIYKKIGFDILPLYRILRKNLPMFLEVGPNMLITQYKKMLEKKLL